MESKSLLISYHHGDKKTVARLGQVLAERGLDIHSIAEAGPTDLDQAQAIAICLGPYGLSHRQKHDITRALARQAKIETGSSQIEGDSPGIQSETLRFQHLFCHPHAEREATDSLFPVIPVLLPNADPAPVFLFPHAWVDLRGSFSPTALDKLAAASMSGAAPLRPIAALIDWCPYRGWQPFREEDAAFFFGREAVTEFLLAKVSEQKIVTFIGPAGSGKTSVVQAGLLPRLRRRSLVAIPYTKNTTPIPCWELLTVTPGSRPFPRLAAVLVDILNPELHPDRRLSVIRRLGNQLAGGEIKLPELIDRLLAHHPGRTHLLLVVDQFEELFTRTPVPERRAFIESLLNALSHPHLSVLLTLRAEFYNEIVTFNSEFVSLEPPTRSELEAAMIKPARPVTLAFEPGLAERILEDITRQANPLPILEFTLSELWWHHQGGLLRHAVYEQIGGVTRAMAYNAERVFQALTPKQQTLARRILTRLVFISPDGHEVSRPLRLPDLWPSLQSTELDRVQGVVRVLVGAKLLTLKRDEITGEERVQTREILACHWPRWQKWVAEEHEFWHWRQHLNILMSGWERGETDENALLQGAELIEAEEWLTKRPDNLDSEGRVYIWQSLAHRNGEQDRRWLVGIGLTVLLILGIVFILIQEMAYLLI